MTQYFGDFSEDDTVYIPFNTFDSNDPSASVTITNLADADIKVHKDGSTTQIVTDGATVAIDFDSVTGQHLITIDTSAHADYSTGSDYLVRIEGTTVDAATVNAWVGSFSIENRYSATAIDAVKAETALIVADTNELQGDWANGGRLDLIQDIIAADTTTDIPALIASLDAVVDTVKAETVLILADTNELQSDDVPTLISNLDAVVDTVKAETALILTDTATTIPGTITTLQADTDDIQTRLPDALVGGFLKSDVYAISSSTAAADNLEASALTIVKATCEGTPSTTVIQTDLAEATDDHYIGRVAIFIDGNAAFQATDITDYTGLTGTITVTALTTAPAVSDTLVIV